MDVLGSLLGLIPLGMRERGMKSKETKELNQNSDKQGTGYPTEWAFGELGTQTSCGPNFHIDGQRAGRR